MKSLHWLAFILIIIGALNWGLIGFFNTDLVALIFGPMTMISRVIYALVGLAAVYFIVAKVTRIKK